jgi:hypothetical protein
MSKIELDSAHVVSVPVQRMVDAAFEIAGGPNGSALVVLHGVTNSKGGVGATVLDAKKPVSEASRFYSGLLLEGLEP